MERNKRKRGLDKPTRRALSALDALILDTIEDSRPPGEGEFLVDDYIEAHRAKGCPITKDAAYNRLSRKSRKGEVAYRKAVIGGRLTNIYRVT